MTLDFETICSLSHGVEYTEIKDGGVHFSRFTRRERELLTYGVEKSFATAGVRLEFETDSKSLALSVSAEKANPKRSFYSFDVYADGKPVGYITNCEGEPNFPYTDEYTFEDREETFTLPMGEKRVCVYFPWSAVGAVKAVELDDGAFVKPAAKKRKIIAYGDSITQGYDSLRPSHSYAARLADILGAELVNKGIGGSVFMPPLAGEKNAYTPDLITVAYGTNDWNICDNAVFRANCDAFYGGLARNYPETPVAAISPIWRADCGEERKLGAFPVVTEIIEETAAKYGSIFFIDGSDFLPKDKALYRDGYLHPNDKGFEIYAAALAEKLKEKVPHLFAE